MAVSTVWLNFGALEEESFDSRQGHEFFSFICDIVPKFGMSGAIASLSVFVRGVHKDIVKPSGARDI